MRTLLLLTWCVLAIGGVGAVVAQQAAVPKPRTPKDLDKLRGNWKLVAQEAAVIGDWYWGSRVWKKYEGRELRKDISGELWARVAGHRVTFTFVRDRKKTTTYAELKLDPSKSPKALDLTFRERNKPPEKALFIYTVEGDKLTVAFDFELGKEPARPKGFQRGKDSHQVILHFQRESK
jgi:uncharacterized protein (TIGR03067 family)